MKENITLLHVHVCCKNDYLTYNMFNLILLPSSSIVLIIQSKPGEVEGGREGQRLKSVVTMNQDGLKVGLPQNTVIGKEGGREGEVNNSDVGTLIRNGTTCSQATSCFCKVL